MRAHVVNISTVVYRCVFTCSHRATHWISTQICCGALLECAVGKEEDQHSREKKNVAVKFYVPHPVAGSALDLQP